MSMRDYAVNDYGMVLTNEQIKMLAKQAIDEETWIENDFEDADVWEYADWLNLDSFGDFTGEAQLVGEDGIPDWRVDVLNGANSLFYIPLAKAPTLFNGAYKNLEEAKAEIAEKIKNAFPVEIHHICGTYFG